MANAARFYWTRIQLAAQTFGEGQDLDKIQDRCCVLINEPRCPKLIQIEAYKLRSRCYLDVYWSAKFQLDCALEIVAECEQEPPCELHPAMNEQSAAAIAQAKQSVQELPAKRTAEYEAEWKAKGREPAPEEDEWYRITEAADAESGEGPMYEVVGDGEPHWGSDLFPGEVPGECPFLNTHLHDKTVEGGQSWPWR